MRERLSLLAGALLLSVAMAGCKDITGPEESLAEARALWLQTAPLNYTITTHVSCECNVDESGPVVAQVRNGVIQSRRYVASGMEVPERYLSRFLTVDGLFDLVERHLGRNDLYFSVQYDRETGYPTRIEFPGQVQQDIYSATILKN